MTLIYKPNHFTLIAGPCSLENEQIATEVAQALAELKVQFPQVNIIFKGSYDKANRTSLKSKRGPGMAEGLQILKMIKQKFGFPVLTDIHETIQVAEVAAVCDVLQIPAFLCRQTDLLIAAADTGKAINVKKGQFMSPYEMQHVVQKLQSAKAKEIFLTERGTTFGYHNLVVDFRSFQIMKQTGLPVIFDVTHSVMLPAGGGASSGGQGEFIPNLGKAACAAGIDGIFAEIHPNPAAAISDPETQISLKLFPSLFKKWFRIWEVNNELK